MRFFAEIIGGIGVSAALGIGVYKLLMIFINGLSNRQKEKTTDEL